MKLTPEQRAAVLCDNDLMLTACPGSGKTRVIIAKLVRVLDEVRGTPRAIGCITYTNAAVHEIEARLYQNLQPGDEHYFDICTIHSFCLNHIFRPFCYLIKGYKSGFKVLSPDSEEFAEHVKAIYDKHGRREPTFKDMEEFTQLSVTIDGKPIGNAIKNGSMTPQMARDYWDRIREAGFVDFANIIYYSLVLLTKRPEILSYVASKFAWLLVDEFQDTTDLQVEILALISGKKRTRFLLVGDTYQSIFGFAGARPDLAQSFAKRIGARTDLGLSGNFRSSKPIIAHAERLYPRKPPMTAQGPAKVFTEQPMRQHGTSAFAVITDHFLPALDAMKIPVGNAAILAPTWFSLFPLGRRLREYGVSIVGPGARPYRRLNTFAPLAEQVCGYLMEPRSDSIVGIERSLFRTVLEITGRARFDIFSYAGRSIVFQLLDAAQRLQAAHENAISWLTAAAQEFSNILIAQELLTPAHAAVFAVSVAEMRAEMIRNEVDIANMTTADLGIYASPDSALKLSSLHFAKGREFDAVAMIDLHDNKIPHYYARSADEIEEYKRLFYVGVTRARRFLLYATDDSERRNGPSRFLGQCFR